MQKLQQHQASEEHTSTVLTQIAEIFEKKQIEQKYTTELLLDFILDKA